MTRQRKFDEAQFHRCVRVLALYRAKRAVMAEIRARGEKLHQYEARQITELAQQHLASHLEPLVTQATADAMTFPEWSWYFANINKSAQPENGPVSTTSALQISGAK